MERIILAHSGGSQTSAAIPWLAQQYHAEVVAVTVDLGQRKMLDAVHERAHRHEHWHRQLCGRR